MAVERTFAPVMLDALNPGLMTGGGNRTYLIAEEQGAATLIDAGVGRTGHLQALASALRATRAALHTVLVTHGHSDHASGAPALVEAYPDAACLKHPWPEEDARVAVPWQPLADGQTVIAGGCALIVLHTPGHSPDHCAFWHEESATVFSGDLVVPGGSVVIQTRRGGDMRAYLASLARILALSPRRLLPAHGDPVHHPLKVLQASIAHRLQREAQVARAVDNGYDTITTIAESIYHGLPASLMPAARENVRAHLEKLRHERPGFPGPVE